MDNLRGSCLGVSGTQNWFLSYESNDVLINLLEYFLLMSNKPRDYLLVNEEDAVKF